MWDEGFFSSSSSFFLFLVDCYFITYIILCTAFHTLPSFNCYFPVFKLTFVPLYTRVKWNPVQNISQFFLAIILPQYFAGKKSNTLPNILIWEILDQLKSTTSNFYPIGSVHLNNLQFYNARTWNLSSYSPCTFIIHNATLPTLNLTLHNVVHESQHSM